jgi:hypothetical protein
LFVCYCLLLLLLLFFVNPKQGVCLAGQHLSLVVLYYLILTFSRVRHFILS